MSKLASNWQLQVRDGQHFYEGEDGLSLPSVTTVLSILNDDEWNQMRGGVGNRTADAILNEAGDIGRQIHGIIARLAAGDRIDEWYCLDGRVRNGVAAYDRFRQQAHYHVRRTETLVCNRELGFAGTEDQDGDVPAGHILLEVKSGKAKPWHPVQLGGYFLGHLDTFRREDIKGGCLLYVDKETGFPHPRFFSRDELLDLGGDFVNLLSAYRSLERIKTGGTKDSWKMSKDNREQT